MRILLAVVAGLLLLSPTFSVAQPKSCSDQYRSCLDPNTENSRKFHGDRAAFCKTTMSTCLQTGNWQTQRANWIGLKRQ